MTPRKIIKWTLAISKTDEDDICLPFGTSVDTDTYGNSEAVNVVDIAVVFKLIEALKFYGDEGSWNWHYTNKERNKISSEVDEDHGDKVREALKLADIIMDEFTDKLEEKV